MNLDYIRMDHYAVGIPVMLGSIAIMLWLQSLIKNLIGRETLRKAHEVGGYYLALVGTFYAVLLGLVVFDAMTKFQNAEKTVESEAKSLLTIFSLSEQFPQQETQIKGLVKDYIGEVIDHELPNMQSGEISDKARSAMLAAVHIVKTIKPQDSNQEGVFPILLQETINWWEARRDRTRTSMFGIPTAEWVVLIIGAIITMTFTFFFTTDIHGVHLVMRALASLLISMSLYLAFLFGSPFSGDMKVSDKPFRFVRVVIEKFL